MENNEDLLKKLTGKNELEAQKAADYLINNIDINLFKMLTEKFEFLFDFVRNNVNKRIEKAVNSSNFKNILAFFDVYSPYLDDLFADILAKHASEELTDEIFDMLQNGSISQKTYSAKYFVYIPDTVALEDLSKYAFCDDEYLSFNSAQALSQMQDDVSFDIALGLLESDDDFDKLKAVKFFSAYGKNYPLNEIFMALKTSKIPENIAGQIPYMVSILKLLSSEYKNDALIVLDYFISGLGEILPLSDIFQAELYEILSYLIDNNNIETENSGKIAQILLSANLKFNEFCNNEEYIFDEDKNTKNEIFEINNLLTSQSVGFWMLQKKFVLLELNTSDDRIHSAINVIKEYKIKEAIPLLKKLLNSKNETLLCEALIALKTMNALDDIDVHSVSSSVKNANIKAIIENLNVL